MADFGALMLGDEYRSGDAVVRRGPLLRKFRWEAVVDHEEATDAHLASGREWERGGPVATLNRLGHRPALDGVRGVAVLLVLAFHARIPGFSGGSMGVIIFFVLSGFLITTLLLEEYQLKYEINFRRFYMRRALRLFPALVVLLLVCVMGGWLFLHGVARHRLYAEVAGAACYVTDWVLATKQRFPASSYLGHTWSLSVEEQFYLIWPVVLYGLLRLRWSRSTKVLVVLLGAVLSAVWRAFVAHAGFTTHAAYGLDTNGVSLLLGCALGMVFAWDLVPKSRIWIISTNVLLAVAIGYLAGACLLGSELPLRLGLEEFGVAAATVLVVVYLLWGPRSILNPLLERQPIMFVGRISYGLYLWHAAVFAVVNSDHFHLSALQLLVLKVTASFALTVVSYYVVERPFLRLKGRFGGGYPSAIRRLDLH